MGLFSGIKKMFSGIGKAVGNIAKGVAKFAKSPFGQLAIQVGLGFITGGTSLFGGAGLLSNLGGAGGLLSSLGSGGGLLSTFSGFASNFLGKASSLLSGSGISGLSGFLSNAGNSNGLLGMVQSLMSARTQAPPTDPTTNTMANQNISQLVAQVQANFIRQALSF